jgi:hypothetical protein
LAMISKVGHSGAQNGLCVDQKKIMKCILITQNFDLSAC